MGDFDEIDAADAEASEVEPIDSEPVDAEIVDSGEPEPEAIQDSK